MKTSRTIEAEAASIAIQHCRMASGHNEPDGPGSQRSYSHSHTQSHTQSQTQSHTQLFTQLHGQPHGRIVLGHFNTELESLPAPRLIAAAALIWRRSDNLARHVHPLFYLRQPAASPADAGNTQMYSLAVMKLLRDMPQCHKHFQKPAHGMAWHEDLTRAAHMHAQYACAHCHDYSLPCMPANPMPAWLQSSQPRRLVTRTRCALRVLRVLRVLSVL